MSGIASGAIEVRRDGQNAWQPLATQIDATGLTAFMDDEVLPKGLYFLRARVVDGAGLEASNDREGAGDPAMLKLPIRLASHLAVGKRGRRVCTGHGKNRRCIHRLATKPKLKVGQATRLYGRLVVGGKPVVGTPVEVWRQLDLDGAQWVQVGTVATSKTGRFSYRAQRGPARKIRFRYPGTGMIRGRNGDVALRVRAGTTLRPSRHNAINGEYVTFRGHLKGGWIPASGVLVELQVYSRGQWRTFAQPRAAAGDGPLVVPLPVRDRQRSRDVPLPREDSPPARLPVHHRRVEPDARQGPRPVISAAPQLSPAHGYREDGAYEWMRRHRP